MLANMLSRMGVMSVTCSLVIASGSMVMFCCFIEARMRRRVSIRALLNSSV